MHHSWSTVYYKPVNRSISSRLPYPESCTVYGSILIARINYSSPHLPQTKKKKPVTFLFPDTGKKKGLHHFRGFTHICNSRVIVIFKGRTLYSCDFPNWPGAGTCSSGPRSEQRDLKIRDEDVTSDKLRCVFLLMYTLLILHRYSFFFYYFLPVSPLNCFRFLRNFTFPYFREGLLNINPANFLGR